VSFGCIFLPLFYPALRSLVAAACGVDHNHIDGRGKMGRAAMPIKMLLCFIPAVDLILALCWVVMTSSIIHDSQGWQVFIIDFDGF
jgi:hypothetical protein